VIVTRNNAAQIIRQHYGDAVSPRFRTTTTVFSRPTVDVMMGRKVLAWRSLATGSDSAVQLGCVVGNVIDWNWSNA